MPSFLRSRITAALAVSALAISPVAAADRVDTAGGDLRLAVGRVAADHAELGLTLDLKPGWKTYWRTPGDSGIPPRIGLADGTPGELAVAYPTPHRFGPADAPSLGYSGRVTLPITVRYAAGQKPARLAVAVKLGVCNEICIPVIEDLTVDVRSGAAATVAAIDAARRTVPAAATAGGPLSVASVRRADAADPAIEVEILGDAGGKVADVFAEAGDDWALPQPARLADADGRSRWRLVLADPPSGHAIDGATVTLTIVGTRGAVEQAVDVPKP
jgi:DsbC/DsbD-like thiol-disulfide interchange protein